VESLKVTLLRHEREAIVQRPTESLEECLRWLEKAQQNKDLWRCFTRLYTRPFLPAGSGRLRRAGRVVEMVDRAPAEASRHQ
jgi:hypothetical protein